MKKYLCLLIILSCLSGCSPQKIAPQATQTAKDYTLYNLTLGLSYVPDSNDAYQKDTLSNLKTLGIEHVRIGQDWSLREPEQGVYNLAPLYKRLDFYSENNISILVTLDIKTIPEWASSLVREDFLKAFDNYVSTILEHCSEQIDIIQVGNEWDWETNQYLNGDTQLYIDMHNILYNNVIEINANPRPKVALGSISCGGLMALAYEQGLIENVYYGDTPQYSHADIVKRTEFINNTNEMAREIIMATNFDMGDIHLYSDYWDWELYTKAYRKVLDDCDKGSKAIIVSEFGGPDPDMEPKEDIFKADQLYQYIRSLDTLNIDLAYYFKLHESIDENAVGHPYSYLISKKGDISKAYDILQNFNH